MFALNIICVLYISHSSSASEEEISKYAAPVLNLQSEILYFLELTMLISISSNCYDVIDVPPLYHPLASFCLSINELSF